MREQAGEPELLRVPEVAERLRCTDEVVRRKIRSGELPGLRLGSGRRAPLRVEKGELDAWLESRHVTRQGTP
jgi:excisionase family DNA binding protein